MNMSTKEYNLGKIFLSDINSPIIKVKVNKPNSTILGEIIANNNEFFNLEIVLCTIDMNHRLIPLNSIKPNLKSFKFHGVPIGQYFILNKKSKELNLGVNSSVTSGPIVSEQIEYNFLNAKLENGAVLDNNWVLFIGGSGDGSATVQVHVNQKGVYELNLEYFEANTFFKLDVNGIDTGTVYQTPNERTGNVSVSVNLNTGNNEIKFHGDLVNYGPKLYKFSLTLSKSSLNYNLVNGFLSGGARIDRNKNMVVDLGGANRGEATIDIMVEKVGYYNMIINFNMGLRTFLIDVNGINTGEVYTVQSEFNGKYRLEISLSQGNNRLRFYGLDTNMAPNLGEFTLDFINDSSPWPEGYNVSKGILENGAKLNNTRNLVLNLGGPQNGSSTVVANVPTAGKYNLGVEYRNGSRYLKIDINKVPMNEDFITPAGDYGIFTTVVTLRAGANEIKFYGLNNEYASSLGNFTLNYIAPTQDPILPPGMYDSASGIFENGAQVELSNKFVTSLGGLQDGSVTINVNIQEKGQYDVDLKYLTTDPNRILRVTVNGRYSGMYTVNVSNSLEVIDAQTLSFKVRLNDGNNQIKFHGDFVNHAPMVGQFKLTLVPAKPTQTSYTFDDLNKLTYQNLVNILKQIKYTDIQGLFEYSNDSYTFYNDDQRVQAIIDELGKSGQSFSDRNEKGIDTLVEVLRSGFFIGYNNQQLSKLNDISYKNKCIPAIKLAMNNISFKLGTTIQDNVILAVGKLIGNASADVEIINKFANILVDFSNNLTVYSNETSKTSAIYKILTEINGFLNRERFRNKGYAGNTVFYDAINPFLTQVEFLAEKGLDFASNGEWLSSNFIHFSGLLSIFRRDTRITQGVITNCLKIYPDLSSQYIEALKRIQFNFNGVLSDGTSINYDNEKERAKSIYIPSEYKFDNDKMVIKTGDRVDAEKIKRLYWAAKEVRAQFMRVANNDNPLESGNADDILTIVIYNSPKEYKVNAFIYGYEVENGGIYIESIGTFFTYERTPQESTFTLEELFRHEYVHYLEGRYLVRGLFGSGDFYQANRLPWFAEGIGEFFAGATRKLGVQPRITIVRYLLDNRNKLSVSKVLRAKYGDNFYNYAFAFVNYMYTRNLGQFFEIIRLLKANDVNGYDSYINNLSNDSITNSLYEQTLTDLTDNVSNYSTPLVSDDYLIRHPSITTNQILTDILSEMSIYTPSIITERSRFFETFTVRGAYDNGVSIDQVSDWKSIDRNLNMVLENLDNKSWSGYKTVTAYFTNYKVDTNGHATFDIVFFGAFTIF